MSTRASTRRTTRNGWRSGARPPDRLIGANSLHFVRDPGAVIDGVRPLLRPGARIVVVEYDSDSGNPWVPYPFSYATWQEIAARAGLLDTRLVGRVPSRFLGAIYAAASDLASRRADPIEGSPQTSMGSS